MFFIVVSFKSCLNEVDFDYLFIRPVLVQSQQWKHQNNAWNLFKVNNKDTRTTSLVVLLSLLLISKIKISEKLNWAMLYVLKNAHLNKNDRFSLQYPHLNETLHRLFIDNGVRKAAFLDSFLLLLF